MPRLLVALVALLLAPAAFAQSPVGVWTHTLTSADGSRTVDTGLIEIRGDGGRVTLNDNGIDGAITEAAIAQRAGGFTMTGVLDLFGTPTPIELVATVQGDAFNGTFRIGPPERPAFGIAAQRTAADAFATMDAQAALAKGPPVDLFESIELPTPNAYRAASGRPGPDYWQQRADYTLEARLDTTAHTVTGTATLRYTNNSPEALDFMWFQLDQNLFREGSRGGPVSGRAESSLAPDHGYQLGAITVDGRAVTPVVTDTRMRLDLSSPIEARGGTVTVTIPYSFVIPGSPGTPRMGRLATKEGTVYAIAQWYPRVAVFDDVNGWNTLPYLGSGEFYLEYGDFDLELTLPSDMSVVSTGALRNESDVYSAAQRQRLAAARGSDERVYIVEPDEVGTAAARHGSGATTTWRFRAENVRDVAWGASASFIVDGARAAVRQSDGSTNSVLIMSAYPAEGVGTTEEPGWEEATRFGRASILNNSKWYPYPYPVAISVASHIGGMEYPMLHFSSVRSRSQSLFGVVDHELGHNWFPMIVGSDERRHAWMDEGFDTFINYSSNVEFYDQTVDASFAGAGNAAQTQAVSILTPDTFSRIIRQFSTVDDEILTYADQLDGREGGLNSYFKPGMGLRILREAVLGPERFDTAFKAYIQRWAYKHPQPADFFRTMEDVSGEDLDWFWTGWFNTIETYDASISDLKLADDEGEQDVEVTVTDGDGLVMPTTVEITFADGTTQRLAVPVEAFGKMESVTVSTPANGRTPVRAELDPDHLLPDTDRSNDVATME